MPHDEPFGVVASTCMSVMANPEVDDAITTPDAVAASMSASSRRFTDKDSGALSWTNPTPSTASARVGATVRLSREAPSANPSSVNAGQAASTSRDNRSAEPSPGSQARTA